MTKQALPAVSVLTTDTLEDFKTADKVVVVAYFDKDDKSSNETFSSVAQSLRDDYLFGAVSDADVIKAEGVKTPSIVLYKSFDEGKAIYSEKFEKEAIEKVKQKPVVEQVLPSLLRGHDAHRSSAPNAILEIDCSAAGRAGVPSGASNLPAPEAVAGVAKAIFAP